LLLESAPECIKEEDFSIFKEFIDAYEKRLIVGKDDAGDDTVVYMTQLKADEYIQTIFEVVEKLKKRFLVLGSR
jgi:hypothetical protein